MKITKHVAVETVESVVEGVICNKCGETWHNTSDKWENSLMHNQFHPLEFLFEHGSAADGETWEFDLCEACVYDLVATFKYAPNGFAQNMVAQTLGDTFQWIVDGDDFQQQLFRLWKDQYLSTGNVILKDNDILRTAFLQRLRVDHSGKSPQDDD